MIMVVQHSEVNRMLDNIMVDFVIKSERRFFVTFLSIPLTINDKRNRSS